MPVNQISELPEAPSRSNPSTFATKADAFLGAFATLRTEINAVTTQMNDYARLASSSEGGGLTAISTTSLAIASSGTKTLTIATGKNFVAGQRVAIWNEAGAKGMAGQITSYNGALDQGTTTTLTVAVTDAIGSGTLASWTVFVIPTTMSFTDTPAGTEIFYPPSVSAVLARTATDTRHGLIEIATGAETKEGTDATRAVSPSGLASLMPDLPVVPPALNLPFWGMAHRPGGVQFTRASSGTYNSLANNVKTAGINIPRFEVDSLTREARGIIIEGASTNLILYSGSIDVTHQLTLTSVTGTFTVGETVNGSAGSGVVSVVTSGSTTYLGLRSVTGAFSGTVTGVTSGATGESTAITAINVPTRAKITSDATVAPDGAATADKLYNDSTASSSHNTYQYCSFTTGLSYTFSAFVKAAEYSRIRLEYGFVGSPGVFLAGTNAIFNISSGAISPSADLTSYGIESVGNGWYRCWITAVCQSSGSEACVITLDNGSAATYDGDNTSGIYVWGTQVEAGDVPTSYTQTTNTAVTRAADVCTTALSGIDFNASEGTVFVDAVTPNGYAAFPKCISLYKDVNNAIYVDRQESGIVRCVVTIGGIIVAQLNLGVVAHGTRFKVAFAWKENDFKAVLNGGAAVTDNAGALPVGLTSLTVGATPANSTANWNSSIRHLTYFPRALTTSQLQAMTL